MLRAPFSFEFDPSEEAEGSIDPLDCSPVTIAWPIGYCLPSPCAWEIRAFVAAIAIAARVCDEWDSDAVAADGVTPLWLVWEWFVVAAFVRNRNSPPETYGVAGIQKVRRALRHQRPVCASAYGHATRTPR